MKFSKYLPYLGLIALILFLITDTSVFIKDISLNTENNLMIASSFTYGYGEQYIQSASERMIKQGWIKERLKGIDLQQIHIIVEDDCKKKEVISHGKER